MEKSTSQIGFDNCISIYKNNSNIFTIRVASDLGRYAIIYDLDWNLIAYLIPKQKNKK